MRVLFISANTEQINMPVLPLGLACVASATEKAGHDVRLLNLMTREDCRSFLEDAVRGFKPQVIAISVRNIDDQCMQAPKFLLEAVKEVVQTCRNLSRAPIVLGGAGYSLFPESILRYLGADMGIRGEGEAAFVMLLDKLDRKEDPSQVPGLVLPHDGNETERHLIRKLDDFPLPLPTGSLSFPQTFENQKVWLPFQTRRGCPMQCSYCSTATIEGKILRKRSIESVIESISRFVEAGFTHFFFVDNTFNLPISYAKELCDQMIARKLNIQWRCILYPWKVDEELVEKMARAGCAEVSLGSESGSKQILRSFNKKFSPEEVRHISEMLGRYEISRMGFLLLGGPAETKETVLESLSFADSLDLESMKLTVGIRIYPYTDLSRIATNEGVISPGRDLLLPTFYLAKELDGWLQETVSEWTSKRPHWYD